MKNKIQILSVIILSAIILSCSKGRVSELPYYDKPDFTPIWISDTDAKNLHKISSFSFTDQDGREISENSLKGKIYAANFFFTSCPGICPKMTANLKKVQSAFQHNDNIKIISYSVMPWADSVPKLKDYEKTFEIKNGMWHLLTGNASRIYELARKSYFAEEDAGYNADSTEFLHTEHILLVDKDGHLRGLYNGTLALEIDRLIEDINILIKEN